MAYRPTRRGLLVVGAGTALAAGVVRRLAAPSSGPHDTYFSVLNVAVRPLGVPVLVVDLQRLQSNARSITERVRAAKLQLRLVVKSLPCLPLLDALDAGTTRYMAFNTTMLAALWQRDPATDVLLGKPMPVAGVRELAAKDPERFRAATNTQWLVDSLERLAEYDALANETGVTFKVSLELDIGLHRGGFSDATEAARALKGHPHLRLAGLMGYDAHVGKTPGPLKARAYDQAQERYRAGVEAVKAAGFDPAALTLNGAGSMTWTRHLAGTAANEVAIGSAFVMPSDFEQEALQPAAFIATPVLKRVEPVQIPGLEVLTGPRTALMPDTTRGVFVFGGHWMANPLSPPGMGFSDLYGRSSNQELLIAGPALQLGVGDFVFYWPTQSEAVLNGFGELVVVDGGQIAARWPVLS